MGGAFSKNQTQDQLIEELRRAIAEKDQAITENIEEICKLRMSKPAVENEKLLVQKPYRSLELMDEAFLRFPHLPEKILEILDNKSLTNSRVVGISWQNFIDERQYPRNYIGMAVTTLVQYPAQIWAELAKPADPQSATIARFSQ